MIENVPTDRTPTKYEPTDKTPAITKVRDLVSRRDKSVINYLANTAIGYVAKNYPLEISRVSRQLSPSGLDMEETMKALLVKVGEWVAWVVIELLYL